MKYIVISLFFMLCLSCLAGRKAEVQNSDSKLDVTTIKITPESVKAPMVYLSSDDLEGRATGTPGIEKAAQFIEGYFSESGIQPFYESYRDSFNLGSIIGYNIVGLIEGNDPALKEEYVVLGGHYDHIGTGVEVDGDRIANGANDDASGTVMAMEIGRYFAATKTNKRSLLITLYAAEELGLKGSGHLAERLKSEDIQVYTMLNFEMVGVPRAEGQAMAYMSGFDRSNFASVLNSYTDSEIIGFFPKAKEFQLFFRSDNYPFFKVFNIPAHAISTFDFTNYDYYHHVDDEADKIDYQHMSSFINKMIPAINGVLNTPTKDVRLNEN